MPYHYPVLNISPQQVVGDEQLGTKPKFWFEHDGGRWLFKETRAIRDVELAGEDWAEKVASEIARLLGIPAAEVELADFGGRRGCASKSFTNSSHQLMHGNEILAGYVAGYDPGYERAAWFTQSDHTLENIVTAIRGMFPNRADSRVVLTQLASYMVLDALIGNVDRHHENWGLLWHVRIDHDDFRETARVHKEYAVAPSYDHASSLGRELPDAKRIGRLTSRTVEAYVRNGHGGIYKTGGTRGENPLGLVESAAVRYPDYFQAALERLTEVSLKALEETIDRVPDSRISTTAREFAKAMLRVSHEALLRIRS